MIGERPGEIASLTDFCIDLAQGVAVLTDHDSTAHLGKVRTVFLCPKDGRHFFGPSKTDRDAPQSPCLYPSAAASL
jgi:hypothetical protein